MWVGTESQISYYGSRSPRIESGRAPSGPFDPRSGERGDSEEGVTDETDPDKLPYNVPRPVAPRRAVPERDDPDVPTGGVELVPGTRKSLGLEDGDEAPDEELDDVAPMMIGVEPSVLSLAEGAESVLQLVARNAPVEPYRVPISISFDPSRVAIDSIATVDGVLARSQDLEPAEGWIELDLEVAAGANKGPNGLAVLRVRALSAGPVPLVVRAGEATRSDGTVVPVTVGNGALFVTDGTVAAGMQ